jgi:hypothetical protein
VIVVAAVAANRSATEPERAAGRASPPARGVACPLLHQASVYFSRDDEAALRKAVAAAQRTALQTLQTSGEAFAAPERIALDLFEEMRQGPDRPERVKLLLGSARDACTELSQWGTGSL